MIIVDIIFLGLFIVAGFSGYKQGMVRQAASLAGLVLGIWGAIHFSNLTANLLVQSLGFTSPFLPLISFAITFLVILVAVHFVGLLVDGLFSLAHLGIINSLVGVVFGVLKVALILSVLIIFIGKANYRFDFLPNDLSTRSLFYGPVERFAPTLFPQLNFEEIRNTLRDKLVPKGDEAL